MCLIDLDYRKKGLTKTLSKDSKFNNFEEFNASRENFIDSNGSLFVPSFEVDSPNDFFFRRIQVRNKGLKRRI